MYVLYIGEYVLWMTFRADTYTDTVTTRHAYTQGEEKTYTGTDNKPVQALSSPTYACVSTAAHPEQIV